MRELIWTSRLSASWLNEAPSEPALSLATFRDASVSGVDEGLLDEAKIWVDRLLRDERAASREAMAASRAEDRELMPSTLKGRREGKENGEMEMERRYIRWRVAVSSVAGGREVIAAIALATRTSRVVRRGLGRLFSASYHSM